MNFGRNSRGTNKNPRATADTICQKCLQRGHFIYECKSAQPYKARPSRSQLLEKPELVRKRGDKPSVEVPEEFKKRSGIANKILQEKEKDREAKRKRSASPSSSGSSSSDSDSESESDSDSGSDSSGSDSDSDSGSSRGTKKRKRVRRTQSPIPEETTKGKGRARSASTGSRASR
ncbi:unnamed protein product [Rhizoctonia solani]|uniref:Zinc knuckle-domain-containing protein n=1 Tax=Rhizoctonia solani TaxID=456999 RepID=A0A8H3DSA7_9AGAM|nr:unnamed protein product [Rhizoctonia solani]CAE6539946.1 unnamed protein product [Rhizoctonia solani]